MDFSLSGLVSGFDWKTFINQIMAVQNAPIDKLNAEKVTNINKNASLNDLATNVTALQTAVTALNSPTLFTSRQATSGTSGSTWGLAAAPGTPSGSYSIAVSQLATVAHRDGTSSVGQPMNSTDDVSGLTIATLPTTVAITAGTFSVNGQKVTVNTTDSLDQVFAAISTATGGDVTASYDHTTDKISLTSLSNSEIVLGAANDTSNFLTALHLTNNGTPTITGGGTLGTTNVNATLANSRLKTPITAVDGSGNGSFTVNGVSVAYNVNTDSLSAVLQRINQSGAGVTASYDGVSDRVVIANATTGDTGIAVSEAAGGLMDALGLSNPAALVHGKNAQFSINGGATQISASNALDSTVHGISGLSVTVDSLSTQTINVSGNTTNMHSAIDGFISAYNTVQSYIDDQSKTSTTVDGKVTTSVLSNDREIQSWADSLRSMAFGAVSGLSGTISRLENLGIDFTSGTSQLAIKDDSKLTAALQNKASDVADYFQTAGTGLVAQLQTFLTKVSGQNSDAQAQLTKNNSDIDTQIAAIQRRLDQQRQLLTNSFIAMEDAQSTIKTQSAALTSAFSSSTSTTSK
jgi:flagellar hook-associated protein 2